MIFKVAGAEVWLVTVALVSWLELANGQEAGVRRRGQVPAGAMTDSREIIGRGGSTNLLSMGKAMPDLPPLPEGVAELKFGDFFHTPVGPKGLELTTKIQALEGRRVRIMGFMVREEVEKDDHQNTDEQPVRGRFMLGPLPTTVSVSHYGLCDDLPPQTLFVTVPEFQDRSLAYTRGPMLLTGVLSLGNRVEPDGRIGSVRLTLDPSAKGETSAKATSDEKGISERSGRSKQGPGALQLKR